MKIMSAGPLGDLAQSTGAVAMGVRLKVNFVKIEDKGLYATGLLDAVVQNVVMPKLSTMSIRTPDGGYWNLPIERMMTMPAGSGGTIVRRQVSGQEKAAAAGKTALSMLGGFMGFGKSNSGGLAGAAGGINTQDAAEVLGQSPNHDVTLKADFEANTLADISQALQIFAQALPK